MPDRTLYRLCHDDMDMPQTSFEKWVELACRHCGRRPEHEAAPTFIDLLKEQGLVGPDADAGEPDVRVLVSGVCPWIVVERESAPAGTADFRPVEQPGRRMLICPECAARWNRV